MPDENIYQTGRKISDKESADVNLRKDDFHGEWNYMDFSSSENSLVFYFYFFTKGLGVSDPYVGKRKIIYEREGAG